MFDPNIPQPLTEIDADQMRAQLTSLKALIDAIVTLTAAHVDGVTTGNPGDPATVEVGAWVKGAGTKMDDDTVQAKMVRVTPPPRLPFHGEVSERPDASAPDFPQGKWVIGWTIVYVTAETRIQGDPPALGAKASGFGELQPDGSLRALALGGR